MSDIRRTHPGYFGVTLACALPWYIGLGVGFTFFKGKPVSASAYELVASYVPLQAWGVAYLTLGLALLIACTIPSVPHTYVRVLTGTGLLFTVFWVINFAVSFAVGKLDVVSVLPAWCTIALVELQAMKEPEDGPVSRRLP